MSRNRCINMLKMDIRIIVLPLLTVLISSCASTKGYYGRAEANVAEVSSQKHNVTVGKKNSWEIAYLCKVDDKVVGNNFKGFPSKCKVLPGRRTIEVEHHQQWKDNSTGLVVAGAMFGAIGGAIAVRQRLQIVCPFIMRSHSMWSKAGRTSSMLRPPRNHPNQPFR